MPGSKYALGQYKPSTGRDVKAWHNEAFKLALEGLTPFAIARRLGKHNSTVRAILYPAERALRAERSRRRPPVPNRVRSPDDNLRRKRREIARLEWKSKGSPVGGLEAIYERYSCL